MMEVGRHRRHRDEPRRSPGLGLAGKTGTAEIGRQRQVRHVVHRVRAGGRPQGRRRGRAREPDAASARRRPARSRSRIVQAILRPEVEYRRLELMATTDQLLNTLFDGRYRIMRKLGVGRDGERLPRRGPGARPPRRDQDPERPARGRRAVRRALPPRGEERREPLAAEHRLDLRPRRGRGHLLHRDGVPRRALAQGAHPVARPGADVGGGRLRAPDPLGASLRASQRHRPPRHQAAQRARRSGGSREGDGLRHRARRREPDDRGGLDHRHRAVPLAGAGARHPGRPARPTSTRSGSSSTRCSRARFRSRATARSRSR